jgi:hypothetical protein
MTTRPEYRDGGSDTAQETRLYSLTLTAFGVLWPECLATVPEVTGSIPGATRFSEK